MNAIECPKPLAETETAPPVQVLRRTFVVAIPLGLHARPCAILIKALEPYRAVIEVEANGEIASGKSILGLLLLAASEGTKVTFTIAGEDAAPAMASVERLFNNNFTR